MIKRPTVLVAALLLAGQVRAESVLQYITADDAGSPLPSSTNQVTDLETCKSVNTANAQIAPSFGYVIDGFAADHSRVTYHDPTSKIAITQSCVPASPWMEPLPRRPLSGAIPPLPPPVPCPAPTARTMILLPIGQSQAANNVEARYTSGANAFMFGDGRCYPLTDPIVGADSNDGSVWSRLADLLLATGRYDYVVVTGAARSGSRVTQWAAGGNLNAHLLHTIQDALDFGLPIRAILWDQGIADAGLLTAEAYRDAFMSMLESIRSLTGAPIYVARSTTCRIRSGNIPQAVTSEFTRAGPDWFVNSEIGKREIRRGQALVVNNRDVRQGADIDAIGPEYLYDGCHPSRIGAGLEAKAWLDVIAE